MSNQDEQAKRFYMVYLGQAAKKGYRYRFFGEENPVEAEKLPSLNGGRVLIYTKKLYTCQPGMIISSEGNQYEEDGSEVTSLYVDGRRFEGVWPDEDAVIQLQAEAEALERSKRQEAAEKKMRNLKLYKQQLKPLKAAYWNCRSGAQRQALISLILDEVTSR